MLRGLERTEEKVNRAGQWERRNLDYTFFDYSLFKTTVLRLRNKDKLWMRATQLYISLFYLTIITTKILKFLEYIYHAIDLNV
jgi:hypothetical protein